MSRESGWWRAGGLTPEENAKLRDYEADEHLLFADRPTLAEDWDACCNDHAVKRCAWWRRGVGILVNRPGFHPAERLGEE